MDAPEQWEHEELIHDANGVVDPMVWENNNPMWSLLRIFSFTSSTVGRLFRYIHTITRADRALMGISEADWQRVRLYLQDKREDDDFQNTSSISISMNASLCMTNEIAATVLHNKYDNGELNETMIRQYVKEFGGKSTGTIADVQNQLEKWFAADIERRPYIIRALKELQAEAKERIDGWKKQNKSIGQVIADLLAQDEKEGGRQGLTKEQVLRVNCLKILLQSSFMPKLYGKGKEYTKRGHQLEPIYAKKLLEESSTAFGGCPVIPEVYENGMVAKCGKPYIKDSNDFVSIQLEDSEVSSDLDSADSDSASENYRPPLNPQRVPLEMKGRVVPGTEQHERQLLSAAQMRNQNSFPVDQKYFAVNSSSPELRQFVHSQDEASQILHHSYTWDSDKSMLVIGDDQGNIVWGITVIMQAQLKRSYGKILKALYIFFLKNLFYSSQLDDALSDDDVCLQRAIRSLNFSYEELNQQFRLWKFVTQRMRMPFPPVARIVPLWISNWNAEKSGSDTKTKMLDSIGFVIPLKNAQATAVGRFLLLLGEVKFRFYQFGSAKKTVSECGSLQRYRKNASARSTYKNSVYHQARSLLAAGHQSSEETTAPPQQECTSQRSNRQTRSSARREIADTNYFQTHGTPHRSVLQQYRRTNSTTNSSSNHPVKYRRGECPGFMVERVNPDAVDNDEADPRVNGGRGTCAVCKASTPWWCRGCHHSFCIQITKNRKKLKNMEADDILDSLEPEKEYVELGSEQVVERKRARTRKIVFYRSCAIMGHQKGICSVEQVDDFANLATSLHETGRFSS